MTEMGDFSSCEASGLVLGPIHTLVSGYHWLFVWGEVPASDAKVKKEWGYTFTPAYAFRACRETTLLLLCVKLCACY